jgi:hypothetical protein
MRAIMRGGLALGVATIVAGMTMGAGPEGAASPRKNVLVELFTSHG